FEVLDGEGKVLLPKHAVSGILFSKAEKDLPASSSVQSYELDGNEVHGTLINELGELASFRMMLEDDQLHIEVWPEEEEDSPLVMEIRTASMSPVYGLGDHGGYEGKTNLFG